MSVAELENAVTRLPAAELDTFARWFEEYLADAWDRRIEADILASRLDKAGHKADEDFEAGRCTLQIDHGTLVVPVRRHCPSA